MDHLIALIASAQEPDGYLYTTRTINPAHPHEWSGTRRWINEESLSHGQAVPSDLYRFAGTNSDPVTLVVNGQTIPIAIKKGDVEIERKWKSSDIVELNLPMPIRRVVANEQVTADLARVALQRGPLVFCAESPDNPGSDVRRLVLPEGRVLAARFEPALLNGVETITGQAGAESASEPPAKAPREFKAIPYFAWANRGKA